MPLTELITNGTFSAGSSGWFGTDIEINPQSAYISGGSGNLVSEIDGNSSQTTVLQQNFSVPAGATLPASTTLTFDTALRNAESTFAGDGFRVEIRDDNGVVIATQDFFPTSRSLTSASMNVTLPTAGNYNLRFTELGDNDSLGAIVDNISLQVDVPLVCFVQGTKIVTKTGEVAVEDLKEGDLVLTRDNGFSPVRWIGSRTITARQQQADHKMRPVVFRAGSLGENMPASDLMVSRQHRMLVADWRAQLLFHEDEVLTAAVNLVNNDTIFLRPAEDVTYYHFMCDVHEVVMANGCWAESFLPTELSLRGLSDEGHEEFRKLFPELLPDVAAATRVARPVAEGKTARLLA